MPTVRLLSSEALDLAIAASGGLPRRLTNVVRSAMIEAADRSADLVTVDHVTAAMRSRGISLPSAALQPVRSAAVASAETNAAPSVPGPASQGSFISRLFARRA